MLKMKIIQNDRGDGKIIFTKDEKKIIEKQGGLTFKAESLKHFADSLVNLCIGMIDNIPTNKRKMGTEYGQHIPSEEERQKSLKPKLPK